MGIRKAETGNRLFCAQSNLRKIAELNLSHNLELTELNVFGTNMSELDVSHNSKLTSLEVGMVPGITSLDLTHNPDLTKVCRNDFQVLFKALQRS